MLHLETTFHDSMNSQWIKSSPDLFIFLWHFLCHSECVRYGWVAYCDSHWLNATSAVTEHLHNIMMLWPFHSEWFPDCKTRNNVDSDLHRVPAKHFVKTNDPKEEALAILKGQGPVSNQKVDDTDLSDMP